MCSVRPFHSMFDDSHFEKMVNAHKKESDGLKKLIPHIAGGKHKKHHRD